MTKYRPLALSLLTPALLLFGYSAQAEIFDLTPYLNKCGGVIYSECDSSTLNQATIFEAALEFAKQQNKDIFLVVGADWCPSCRHFNEMLEADEDREKLLNKVVFLELNGDLKSTKKLARDVGFSYFGYPQAFIIDSKTTEVKKMFYPSSSKNVKELMAKLEYNIEDSLETKLPKPEAVAQVSTSTLEADIQLTKSYGRADFYQKPQTEAESYVNQGIAAFHLFQYVDAFRSFKKAESKDPNLTMAHVGQIMSILKISGDDDAQYFVESAVNKLRDLKAAGGLSWKDQAWLEYGKSYAVSRSRSYTMRSGEKIKSLSETIKSLHNYDSENLDGLALISWDAISTIGEDAVRELLERTLSKHPRNVGANHYMIHLSEFKNDIKSAQKHGSLLKDLAPGSAHGQHMYGHTLPQTGDWKKALQYFEKAHEIHMDWASDLNVEPSEDWHYSHNLDLMAATHLGLGNLEQAAVIWSHAADYDYRALPHFLSALILNGDDQLTDSIFAQYEAQSENARLYISDFRHELELTPKGLMKLGAPTIEVEDSAYIQMRKVVEIAFVEGQKISSADEARFSKYFADRFQSGGFDGWSNAFLELLRLERVMKILGYDTNSLGQLESLKFAAQNGSLCGPEKKESLTPCDPIEEDRPILE